MNNIILLILNQKLYELGEITKEEKEKLDMEILRAE